MFDHNIGKHCSQSTCKQKDWLPIKCKYCSQTFCADHCSIQSHSCKQYAKQYKKVYSCPLCNKIVNINSNLSVQQNFSIHEALDLTAPKCRGTRCQAKLTQLNSYTCNKCMQKVCLKHRMPQDHLCKVK